MTTKAKHVMGWAAALVLLVSGVPAVAQVGTCPCDGDVTGDGAVNFFDIATVIDCINGTCAGCSSSCDVDCDGDVDYVDMGVAACQFNRGFADPTCCDEPTGACEDPSHPALPDCIVTTADGCGVFSGTYQGDGTFCITKCVGPGDDCFHTACDGNTSYDFAQSPIPNDFFCPGSLPFDGVVELGGSGGFPGDTIVRRHQAFCYDDNQLPQAATVDIELVQLELRSCAPITVQGCPPTQQSWDVYVTIPPPPSQPLGSMTAVKEDPTGGTFTASLPVNALVCFGPAGFGSCTTPFVPAAPTTLDTIAPSPWLQNCPTCDLGCGSNGFSAGWTLNPDTGEPCCEETCHQGPAPGHDHCTSPPKCPPCPPDPDPDDCPLANNHCVDRAAQGDCVGVDGQLCWPRVVSMSVDGTLTIHECQCFDDECGPIDITIVATGEQVFSCPFDCPDPTQPCYIHLDGVSTGQTSIVDTQTGGARVTCECDAGPQKCADPGEDCFTTPCDGSTGFSFEPTPIPGGFFNPGSEPFEGIIILGGPTGFHDTVVRRHVQMCFDDTVLPDAQSTPIELVQLNLVSCNPITVTYNNGNPDELWDVQVGLQGPQPQGTMTAVKTHPNGGTYSADLPVHSQFFFVRVGDGLTRGPLPAPPILLSTLCEGTWLQDCPACDRGCGSTGFFPGWDQVPGTQQPCCTTTCHAGPAPDHEHCTEPPKCDPCPDEPPTGVCCLDVTDDKFIYEQCKEVDAQCCLDNGGVYLGDGTTCEREACCLQNGSCDNIDPRCCIESGGVPQGPGSVCLGDGNNNGIDDVCEAPPVDCVPTADGLRCEPFACPDADELCLPRCVRIDPATGEFNVVDCDCVGQDDCRVKGSFGALPRDAGGPTPSILANRGPGGPDPCVVTDNGSGTVTLPPEGCEYLSADEVHEIIDGLPAGTTIQVAAIHRGFFCKQCIGGSNNGNECSDDSDCPGGGICIIRNDTCSTGGPGAEVQCEEPGGSLGGNIECSESELQLDMDGTGALSGFARSIPLRIEFETHTGPRTLGDPVQSFPTDMFRLFGEITGDPDFDLLRITAGTDFGYPSPGHTTLTRLPSGDWGVDSFFDITYRIDFVGAPGGPLAGMSGSTTATIRMSTGVPFSCTGTCPPGQECHEEIVTNADGSFTLCCECVDVPPPVCEPTADGLRCENVACPDGDELCLPRCVRIDPATGEFNVVDCDCVGQDDCRVKGSFGALPRDAGGPTPSILANRGPGGPDPCVVTDNGSGTVTLPPEGCEYLSADEVHEIIDGLPAGTTIQVAAIHRGFFCKQCIGGSNNGNECSDDSDCPGGGICIIRNDTCSTGGPGAEVQCEEPGGSLGGNIECSESELQLDMDGTGALSGFARSIPLRIEFETHTGPRTPGDPVQSFPTDMFRLFGEITGDPDFDLLRITAGTDFGYPSPGHTTLTRLPSGDWGVDSFFDITYRIDFVGAPGGPLAGMSGSTTATIRMSTGVPFSCTGTCPPGQECHEEIVTNPDGSFTLCCECVDVPPPVCEPTADGLRCENVACPDGDDLCLPRCVRIDPATGEFNVVDCDCVGQDDCRVKGSFGALPRDAGGPTPSILANRGPGGPDPCVVTDNGSGTVTLPPDGCEYLSPDEVHEIIDGLPVGTTIEFAAIHKDFICHKQPGGGVCSFPPGVDCDEPGGSLGGEKECASSTLEMALNGTGSLAGFNRLIPIPVGFETHTGPRTPGDPVQSFPTDMFRLFGQITGDPDFDLLRITAGTDFGLPSPGHTTLTRLPSGDWAVDSFFDITYRIDFVGAPGGALSGMSGSTTGTIRMSTGVPFSCTGNCPAGEVCREEIVTNPDGSFTLCCECVPDVLVCEPNAVGSACNPVVCPVAGEECVPTKVFCDATGCRITECECRDPNVCHIDLGATGAPICVGGCPPGRVCVRRGTDLNGDGTLDEFECICVTRPPILVAHPVKKPRYLTIDLGGSPIIAGSLEQAIRIRIDTLQNPVPPNPPGNPPPDFSAYHGQVRWVGPPNAYPEGATALPSFAASFVHCDPHFHDWSGLGDLHVAGAEIVPSSRYTLQAVSEDCPDLSDEDCYSDPVIFETTRWGDVAVPFNPPSPSTQPDVSDIALIVTKFGGNTPPTKPQVQLNLNVPAPDRLIDVSDISQCVNAFQGQAYPFSGPCPCPSTTTCSTSTPCTSNADCAAGQICAGGHCSQTSSVDTCRRCTSP